MRCARRAVDDDRRDAARVRHRELTHDRAGAGLAAELGGERRRHPGARRRRGHALHAERDVPEGDDVVFAGDGFGDAGAIQEGAVGGAEVLHLHPAVGEAELRVPAGDGGVVNRDVAGDGPPHDDGPAGLEVDRLIARRAQQLKHRPEYIAFRVAGFSQGRPARAG